MMSLSQFSYAISYIIFQGIFQVIGSTIMAGFLIYNESVWGPVDTLSRSLQFWCCSLLFCCGQIPYAMAISSFFKDPKVANTIGGLLIILPIAFFLQLASVNDGSKYVMYLLFWLPIIPTCSILVKISGGIAIPGVPSFFNIDFIPIELCWFFMVLNMFIWLFIYFYLDNVLPSEYGIQKHPCFCFRKALPRSEKYTAFEGN